jgi:hypothetical protein
MATQPPFGPIGTGPIGTVPIATIFVPAAGPPQFPPGVMPGNPAEGTGWIGPPEQVQLHSWTWSYNLNLIGKDRLPAGVVPGEPVYDLAPGQRVPEQTQLHSWTWSYNLNLIGKDRLPAGVVPGEPVYDLAPGQRVPEQVQLHSWTWSYNRNLVGKDVLPTGVFPGNELYDLAPAQKPYEQAQLHSWQWWYNLNLIGQDFRAPGQQIYDRPQLPIPPAALTWIEEPIEEIAQPFRQSDWPLPTPTWRLDQTYAVKYNQNLIGQDVLPTGQQVFELTPRPPLRAQDLLTWIQSVNLSLAAGVPDLTKIARQSDWPLPRGAEPDWRRSWEYWYNQNLIGQDARLAGQQFTELAPRSAEPDPRRSWQWWYNENLIGQDKLPPGVSLFDLAPSQKPPEQIQLHSWQWWYNLNLLGQDKLPFRQSDWPLTPAAQRGVELATWLDRVKFWFFKPFAQTDWPLPTPFARDPTLATFVAWYNLNLIGQDARLAGARVYDLVPPAAPLGLGTAAYTQSLNPNILLPPADLTKIARQSDWPVPFGPLQPDRGYFRGFNPNLPPPPPPVTGPAVYNKPMHAGPGYLDVIPSIKPS